MIVNSSLTVTLEWIPEWILKPSSSQGCSICHWNFNNIAEHNYIELALLRAYVSTHKFDVISVSETYLNSDTSTVDGNLEIVC